MKTRWFTALVVVIFTFMALAGCTKEAKHASDPAAAPTPDYSIPYEVINDQDYGTDLKNHSFRVMAAADASDNQLLWVFNKLDNNKWRDVIVWFYKDKATVNAGDPYNIAMIKRTGDGVPEITK
ncbi:MULTISPECIES: hypothetical protein [unclassified Dehalobacter]|uniref:hypothetical protein n=1 Tax=unclassified Dehalobacter TaxID=2635733 RepID=UPI001046C9A2|nr:MULTISPECIES: hypothetical protein [unclassified Dehalobacter]TCX51982.1 hypothetical protein C1I36_06595 [Dehalobacter sp. 14DCB1]TCX53042.1 hypothetical protein C1I38_08275 [Dehalobacter sp. 12DCB1]